MDSEYVERLASEYKSTKELADNTDKRLKRLRGEIATVVLEEGLADDKGHKWLEAGAYKIKYERRVSQSFDAAAAEEWARLNGVWDKISVTVEALDEDKLLGLAWNDPQYADQIKSFYKETVSWALKV